jgi:hypothetical protein
VSETARFKRLDPNRDRNRSWKDLARDLAITHLRSLYGRLTVLGASAAELQDVASLTYAGNVYREEGE